MLIFILYAKTNSTEEFNDQYLRGEAEWILLLFELRLCYYLNCLMSI